MQTKDEFKRAAKTPCVGGWRSRCDCGIPRGIGRRRARRVARLRMALETRLLKREGQGGGD